MRPRSEGVIEWTRARGRAWSHRAQGRDHGESRWIDRRSFTPTRNHAVGRFYSTTWDQFSELMQETQRPVVLSLLRIAGARVALLATVAVPDVVPEDYWSSMRSLRCPPPGGLFLPNGPGKLCTKRERPLGWPPGHPRHDSEYRAVGWSPVPVLHNSGGRPMHRVSERCVR